MRSEYRKLSEVADVSGGVALGRAVPEGASVKLPYLRVANVQDGFIDTSDIKLVRVTRDESNRFRLHKGDVLLTEGGDFDKLGRGAVWDGRIDPCLHQNHIFRVRCHPNLIIPDFLALYLSSQEGRKHFTKIAKQTTNLATISSSQLKAMPVPCPPLLEQRRIIEALDAINDQAKAAQKSLDKEKLLWNGVINHQLENHYKKFDTVSLERASLIRGEYGSNSPAIEYNDTLPRYVRITDIDDNGSLSAHASPVSLPQEKATPHLLRRGDLLIARTGFTTGKSYLYREEDGLCAFAGYLVRFRIDPTLMLPEYAFMWTRSNDFKQWVSRNVREVGQRNISAREFGAYEISCPPLEVQQTTVSAWEASRISAQLQEQQISKLQGLKRGLADNLLSGRVSARGLA